MKNRIRMWQLVLVAIVFAAISIAVNPSMSYGWGSQAILQVGKASLANALLYWILRLVLSTRTHTLRDEALMYRESSLVLAHGFVTGCVLMAG